MPQEAIESRTVVLAPDDSARAAIAVAFPNSRAIIQPLDDSARLEWLRTILSAEAERLAKAWASVPPIGRGGFDDRPSPAPPESLRPVAPPAQGSGRPTISPSVDNLANEVQKLAQWYGPRDARTLRAVDAYNNHPDARPGETDLRIRQGTESATILDNLERLARLHGPDHDIVVEFTTQTIKQRPYLRTAVNKKLIYAKEARARREAEKEARSKKKPLSTIRPNSVSHRLQDQQPAKAWHLYIDETGNRFEAGQSAGTQGRIVGIAVPSTYVLPSLDKAFHSTEATNDQVDALLQVVLNAPVGIFGISADGLPPTAGDRWLSGVIEVIQWTARLVPMNGPTCLTVLVERRGEQDGQASLSALRDQLLRELVERDANRYRDLSLEIRVLAKWSDLRLAYADVVAYTWGSGSPSSRERLRLSGLDGTCLVGGSAVELRRAWDDLGAGSRIEGETWRKAISSPDASTPSSITAGLLARLGEDCRADVALWRRLVESALAHLDSKAVHLPSVGREVDWLQTWQPPTTTLPRTLRLAWLIGMLEASNHLGDVDTRHEAEIARLGDELFDECPELVCQADLNRAVLATNRFDFAEATRSLARWVDQPKALPGLRHWARVQSSLGQHAAFTGRFQDAQERFREALEAFGRLSDPEMACAESLHTCTYAAITAIDDPTEELVLVRALVSAVTPLDADGIRRISKSDAPADKYPHHLLLRYLAVRGSDDERATYLDERASWSDGAGHPWQLVHAYRAHLLRVVDPKGARDHAARAVELADGAEQGLTVRFIRAAIKAAARSLGADLGPSDTELAELARLLPHARDRVERLRVLRDDRAPFLDVLRELLPFNFR